MKSKDLSARVIIVLRFWWKLTPPYWIWVSLVFVIMIFGKIVKSVFGLSSQNTGKNDHSRAFKGTDGATKISKRAGYAHPSNHANVKRLSTILDVNEEESQKSIDVGQQKMSNCGEENKENVIGKVLSSGAIVPAKLISSITQLRPKTMIVAQTLDQEIKNVQLKQTGIEITKDLPPQKPERKSLLLQEGVLRQVNDNCNIKGKGYRSESSQPAEVEPSKAPKPKPRFSLRYKEKYEDPKPIPKKRTSLNLTSPKLGEKENDGNDYISITEMESFTIIKPFVKPRPDKHKQESIKVSIENPEE